MLHDGRAVLSAVGGACVGGSRDASVASPPGASLLWVAPCTSLRAHVIMALRRGGEEGGRESAGGKSAGNEHPLGCVRAAADDRIFSKRFARSPCVGSTLDAIL